ncbi:unnamed protein product [Dicrocoelium dendriticum]|nr:unnamed protein product [Dicrocoelium dendriticum]
MSSSKDKSQKSSTKSGSANSQSHKIGKLLHRSASSSHSKSSEEKWCESLWVKYATFMNSSDHNAID